MNTAKQRFLVMAVVAAIIPDVANTARATPGVIDLSTLTFTNQADIVPASETAEIINTGVANTLGGADEITSTGGSLNNFGNIDTGKGKDSITATGTGNGGIIQRRLSTTSVPLIPVRVTTPSLA